MAAFILVVHESSKTCHSLAASLLCFRLFRGAFKQRETETVTATSSAALVVLTLSCCESHFILKRTSIAGKADKKRKVFVVVLFIYVRKMPEHGMLALSDESIDSKVASTSSLETEMSKQAHACGYCDRSYPFLSLLRAHERKHTGEKPFQCAYCTKCFAQRSGLAIHERRHTGIKPYQCQYCDKAFASPGNMKSHERQHTGIKPHACHLCDKKFATVSNLRTHMISHSEEKAFSCDQCGKHFAHRTSLYSHKKRHMVAAEQNISNGDSDMSIATSSSVNGSCEDTRFNVPTSRGRGRGRGSSRASDDRGKRWECRFCGKVFAFKYPMIAHERVHTGERPFICKYCTKSFSQQTSLIMHERSHTGERRYKCDICDKRFIQPSALHSHRRTHTGERPYQCKLCPKNFAHATSLRQHQHVHLKQEQSMRMAMASAEEMVSGGSVASPQSVDWSLTSDQSGGTSFDQPGAAVLQQLLRKEPVVMPKREHTCCCGKSFPYMSALVAHMRSHTGEKPFQCRFCEKRFAQKATCHVHERTHTGERPYKCRHCDRCFSQYGTKSVHEKTHLGVRNYQCPTCDKMLSSPSALYTHKKTHGDRQFQCPLCPKKFTLKNYVKLHIRQVHKKESKEHPCTVCGKVFGYVGSLQVHMRTHTGERPYKCSYCEKAFTSRGNLQCHERIHTGERPYQCKTCGRRFAQRSQLVSHETVHKPGGKPAEFACKYCDKRFGYSSSLYVHIRLHTGERPYKCQYCDKAFTSQGNRLVHERVHTGEKPFVCTLCGKPYAQRVGLRIHTEQCKRRFEEQMEENNISSSDMAPEDTAPNVCPNLSFQSTPAVAKVDEGQKLAKRRRLENLLPKLFQNYIGDKDPDENNVELQLPEAAEDQPDAIEPKYCVENLQANGSTNLQDPIDPSLS
ncbi:hypothetical protein M513_10123 [Trichuris suis]|uniref:C2H2-type domain-containing protein n=2 Tax=Trichuris suis TaxID=68888 RepID=A0A085LVH5_9BILA|nr:hypothetical protein M513_10123 [Trichuris suis]